MKTKTCPFLIIATVLAPPSISGDCMNCKREGCAMWNEQASRCGLTCHMSQLESALIAEEDTDDHK